MPHNEDVEGTEGSAVDVFLLGTLATWFKRQMWPVRHGLLSKS